MHYLFKIQEKIVPELISKAENRYTILRNIYYHHPVGRRTLSEKTGLSERKIRCEIRFLKKRGLINISRAGAVISKSGSNFLLELDKYIKEIKGIKILEEKLERLLGIKQTFIVPGNLEYSTVIQEIGRYTAHLIIDMLKNGDILAVTGGSTLAQVAKSMRYNGAPLDVLVVPGRGGLGEEVDIQANTIAATIAKKIGGSYHLLYIPDSMREENVDRITAEPSIQKILKSLQKSNILLHGVGNAEVMARRRDMSAEQVDEVLRKGAVAEALGYYFNKNGEIIHTTTSVGLHLEDLEDIEKVIVVAGGIQKAQAIVSVVSPKYHDCLITDELTAKKILDSK